MTHTLQEFRGKILPFRDGDLNLIGILIIDSIRRSKGFESFGTLPEEWTQLFKGAAPGCVIIDFDQLLDTPQRLDEFHQLLDDVLHNLAQYKEVVPASFLNSRVLLPGTYFRKGCPIPVAIAAIETLRIFLFGASDKMKFNARIDLSMLSTLSMRRQADFFKLVRTYCDLLPNLLPEKWGWWEPLDHVFDPQNLRQLIGSDGQCHTIHWERKKKPKAVGSFFVRWTGTPPKVRDTHSSANLSAELGAVDQNGLLGWLKASSVGAHADLAFVDSVTKSYRDFAMQSHSATYGDYFFITTHVLRHWLPDMFWGTVFGPPYVKLFGKERLLSAPVAVAEEIAEDMVYVQLTDKLADVVNDFSGVQEQRRKVKEHLAVDAFFVSDRGYDYRKREPYGDVFSVPKFELVDD